MVRHGTACAMDTVFRYVTVCLMLPALLFTGCAKRIYMAWDTNVVYKKENIGKNRLERGNSILVLPMLAHGEFDTTGVMEPRIVRLLENRFQGPIQVLYRKDFENNLSEGRTLASEKFYEALRKNDILAFNTNDEAWGGIKAKYLFFISVSNGLNIRSFSGVRKRKAVVEISFFDVNSREMLWQGKAEGYAIHEQYSDYDFIERGASEIIKKFPEFVPASNEGVW